MKGKTFLILLVAAGALVALAWFRFGNQTPSGDTTMGKKLFTDLPMNQVSSITIADAEHRVTLIQGDRTWQVQDRGGYPADFGQLRDVVVRLSRLKIGRSFTGTPESLARLSLLAPSAAEEKGRGTQMTFKDASGKVLADVILGQARQTDGGGSGGQYLKKADADTVYLVDGSFRFLKTAPAEWLQKDILDIKSDQVASVACYRGSQPAPVYTLSRSEKGQPPQMAPVPKGRQVDSAKVDQVFDALAPLTLDDVATGADPKTRAADADRLVYRLYDGRQITLFPESDGKENYRVRITAEAVAAEMAQAHAAAPATTEKGKDEPDPASGTGADEKAKAEDSPPVKTVQQINDELSPWVFMVKKWQFDSFITQPEDLLESVEDKAAGKSS